MKRKLFTYFVLLTIGFGLWQGCKTSPERKVVATEQAIVGTTDAALAVWFEYVKVEQKRVANDPTGLAALAAKEEQVRQAYDKYRVAGQAVVAAQIAAHNTTNGVPAEIVSALAAASAPLTQLIETLRK